MHNRFTFLFVFLCIVNATALDATEIPPLHGALNDNANLLNASEKAQIEKFLVDFDKKTNAQIAVITVKSLQDEDINSFALNVAERWKIGEKNLDSGVIIVIAHNEHEIAIKTGYGAEGALTDAKCGLIIRNIMAPAFQNGDYGVGILDACKTIGGILSGDETLIAENTFAQENETGTDALSASLGFFVLFIVFMLFASRSRFGWLPFLFFPRFGGSRSGRNFSGYSSGSGFSGGGGRFGGGGASGKW